MDSLSMFEEGMLSTLSKDWILRLSNFALIPIVRIEFFVNRSSLVIGMSGIVKSHVPVLDVCCGIQLFLKQ